MATEQTEQVRGCRRINYGLGSDGSRGGPPHSPLMPSCRHHANLRGRLPAGLLLLCDPRATLGRGFGLTQAPGSLLGRLGQC